MLAQNNNNNNKNAHEINTESKTGSRIVGDGNANITAKRYA